MSPDVAWSAALTAPAVATVSRQHNNRLIRTDTMASLLSIRNPAPFQGVLAGWAPPRGWPESRNRDSPDGDSHTTLRVAMRRLVALLILGLTNLTSPAVAQTPQSARRTLLVTVVEKVSPAVVNISAQSTVREADPFFGLF